MTPNPNNPNDSPRAAQILLTAVDRSLTDGISRRVVGRGRRVAGPTTVYRAGLLALGALDDAELIGIFDQIDDRPTLAQLHERYRQWCAVIGERVGTASPRLQYAWNGARNPEDIGHFSDGPRFALLSMVQDGRVLISGMQAVLEPVGGRIPRAPLLFPGGLAKFLSMTGEGADLATRAIIAWLLSDDDGVVNVRKEIAQHHAEPLR